MLPLSPIQLGDDSLPYPAQSRVDFLKQLEMDYSHADYVLTMKQLEGALSSEEIFSMGKVFMCEKC